MTRTVGITELIRDPSTFIREAAAGEAFVITEGGVAIAMLVPVPSTGVATVEAKPPEGEML